MDTRRPTIVTLVTCGLAMLFVGCTGLGAPRELLAPLAIPLDGPGAHNEIRAAYGGMHAGLGLFLLVTALQPALRRVGLWLTLCVLGGLVAGRLVSLVVDGDPGRYPLGLLAVESTGAVASLALLVPRSRGGASGPTQT